MNQEELWSAVMHQLLDGVSADDPKSVFLTLVKPFRIFGDQFVLLAENAQVESWVRTNYLDEIQSTLDAIATESYHVNIASNEDMGDSSAQQASHAAGTSHSAHAARESHTPSAQPAQQTAQSTAQPAHPFTMPKMHGEASAPAPETPQPAWMNQYVTPEEIKATAPQQKRNAPEAESMVARGASHDPNSPTSGREILFERFTFDTFVVGPSNKFARGVALAVAEQPGMAYNPVFIYGNSGLGKTHLLAAIANYVVTNFPRMAVVYASANDFTNDFVQSVQANDWLSFNKKYHQADILLIDDVQYLEGRNETIDQLFNIFNEMVNQHKQIVLSADRAPKDIDMDDRMRSRFLTGTTPDINPPDYETRLAILRNYLPRALPQNFVGTVPDDVLEYVAKVSTSNVREIEGAVNQLVTHMSVLHKTDISVDEAKEILQDFFLETDKKQVSIAGIQAEVERYFGVSHEDMVSAKRSRDIAYARHVAIYLSRWLTEESLESIGKKFGGRDHTTIMHSANKIDKDQKDNRTLFDQIEQLTARIKGHS